ncbi:MAG: Dabb family protein [Verrucomicrobiota bacterium]
MITHVVIFWVDKPHAENKAHLLAAAAKLGDVPGCENFRFGGPVPSPRGAVDDSFAVAISMEFADAASAQVYQEHPIHQEFVAGAFKTYCKRFVVYDFES